MSTPAIKNELKYNFIDYKQPVNVIENDFRTSSYLGHRYFKQNDFTIPSAHSLISPMYVLQQKEIRYDYGSEHAAQYTRKHNFNRTNKANLYINCSKPTFVKSMEHRIFTRTPKPIRNNSSHYRDYANLPQTDKNFVTLDRDSCVGKLSAYTDCDDGGCYKYDSTHMNVYKQHKTAIPPGCSEEIATVWNHCDTPKLRISDYPLNKIVGNKSTFLRHKGMKSENQSAYTVPVPKKLNCDVLA